MNEWPQKKKTSLQIRPRLAREVREPLDLFVFPLTAPGNLPSQLETGLLGNSIYNSPGIANLP